MSVNFVYVW